MVTFPGFSNLITIPGVGNSHVKCNLQFAEDQIYFFLEHKKRSKDLEMDYTQDGNEVDFEKLSERLYKVMKQYAQEQQEEKPFISLIIFTTKSDSLNKKHIDEKFK